MFIASNLKVLRWGDVEVFLDDDFVNIQNHVGFVVCNILWINV